MSRLTTVRRVAQLREAGARAAVSSASAAQVVAVREHQLRLNALQERTLSAGPATLLGAELAGRHRSADAVTQAAAEVAACAAARAQALVGWTAAARREQLLDTVCARSIALAATEHERRSQRVADDLAGSRARGGS